MTTAWAQLNTREAPGAAENPAIIRYFSTIGRNDITSESTAWCGAFAAFCLHDAGIPLALRKDELLVARAYLKQGTELAVTDLRYGALVILDRDGGEDWWAHVGFVVGWTDLHVQVLGGNQRNAVNVMSFSRSKIIGVRWPVPPVTAAQVKEAGSRTMVAAGAAKAAAGKAGAAQVTAQVQPDAAPEVGIADIAKDAGAFKQTLETLLSFADFVWDKWPVIAFGLTLYWVLKAGWHTSLVELFRKEDHNTGANGGRQ